VRYVVRYVLLLAGTFLLGSGCAHGWSWYVGGLAYPESVAGTQRQMGVMVGGMILLGCALIGAGIGSWKQARLEGLFLGLICGPLGVIAAFFPDNRSKCPQCSARLDATARACPHCQTVLALREPNPRTNSEGWDNRNVERDRRRADWRAGGKTKGR
jgi:hypothetical protein